MRQRCHTVDRTRPADHLRRDTCGLERPLGEPVEVRRHDDPDRSALDELGQRLVNPTGNLEPLVAFRGRLEESS